MAKVNGLASTKPGAISLEAPTEDENKYGIPEEELADAEEVKIDFRLTKYIKVFDDALPPKYCDKIIKMFREDADHHIARNSDGEHFVSCNIERSAQWEEISATQRKIVEATMPVYAKSVAPHQAQFPEQSMVEDFHVYQFRNNEDCKEISVDVQHYGQARRYLTFIWFLTTDENFELGFFDVQNTVSAKAGRLIVFPSTWTYPYSIANSENNENFLMKTHVTMV